MRSLLGQDSIDQVTARELQHRAEVAYGVSLVISPIRKKGNSGIEYLVLQVDFLFHNDRKMYHNCPPYEHFYSLFVIEDIDLAMKEALLGWETWVDEWMRNA